MQEFGKLLAKARRRKKWSQQKLARVTGLSRSYVNDIEHGRSVGTVATWVMLARALGLSLDGMFLGEAANLAGLTICRESRCRYCARPAADRQGHQRNKKQT